MKDVHAYQLKYAYIRIQIEEHASEYNINELILIVCFTKVQEICSSLFKIKNIFSTFTFKKISFTFVYRIRTCALMFMFHRTAHSTERERDSYQKHHEEA
jgi:hypothetical protein